jgi:hypothetical protein
MIGRCITVAGLAFLANQAVALADQLAVLAVAEIAGIAASSAASTVRS